MQKIKIGTYNNNEYKYIKNGNCMKKQIILEAVSKQVINKKLWRRNINNTFKNPQVKGKNIKIKQKIK